MNGWDGDDDGPELDENFEFPVTCECGCEYSNLEDGCPSCGAVAGSYSSADAARWNDHLRRTGR